MHLSHSGRDIYNLTTFPLPFLWEEIDATGTYSDYKFFAAKGTLQGL
jgi:hypothetical protein